MYRKLGYLLFFMFFLLPSFSDAATEKKQFQLNGGVGVFTGNHQIDPSIDLMIAPEYFLTKHISVALRFDGTAGGIDTIHLGGRGHYYFDFVNHENLNLYVGIGIGVVGDFGPGGNLGDLALPVIGFQYDLTDHIKIGSEFSFDILFNGDGTALATRLLPVVVKWAF